MLPIVLGFWRLFKETDLSSWRLDAKWLKLVFFSPLNFFYVFYVLVLNEFDFCKHRNQQLEVYRNFFGPLREIRTVLTGLTLLCLYTVLICSLQMRFNPEDDFCAWYILAMDLSYSRQVFW